MVYKTYFIAKKPVQSRLSFGPAIKVTGVVFAAGLQDWANTRLAFYTACTIVHPGGTGVWIAFPVGNELAERIAGKELIIRRPVLIGLA